MTRSCFFGMVSTRASLEYTAVGVSSFFDKTPFGPHDRFFLIDNDLSLAPGSFSASLPIHLVKNPAPLGFAENVNQIIDRALTDQADLVFVNNDLVFTKNWLLPLRGDEPHILSPLSNREVQYAASVHVVKTRHISNVFVSALEMKLSDYSGHEAATEAIAEAHRRSAAGRMPVYVLPFFCVKIPYAVMQEIGHFDVKFGKAGGEDYDYCLRAWLAGFRVEFVLDSWILHFYGKSSWAGAEAPADTLARESAFMAYFREKWGEDLFQLVLRENDKVLEQNNLSSDAKNGGLRDNIIELMKGKTAQLRL